MTALDITAEYIRWFNRWLTDVQPSPEPPAVRIFVMGRDVWRDESDWPPPDVRLRRYYLGSQGHANTAHGDGRLTLARRPAEDLRMPDTFVYDPQSPVPTTGGGALLRGAEVSRRAGPTDQCSVESRADVLCYTGPLLQSPLETVGPVGLRLFVSSSVNDTDFTAKLVDVWSDDRAEFVCDGILRCRQRPAMGGPRWLEPDVVYELTIDLGATAYLFPAGHRVRLEISGSNFPRFDANPNTGPDRLAAAQVAVNRVYHDERYLSALVLPVRPAGL